MAIQKYRSAAVSFSVNLLRFRLLHLHVLTSELPRFRLLHLSVPPFSGKVVHVEYVKDRKDFLNLRELL